MTFIISGAPESIEGEEEFVVNIVINDAPKERTYYLQAVFTATEGRPSYFGYTENHNREWFKYGEDHKEFFRMETSSEGTWSGKLKTKPDISSSSFKGAGQYEFKAGRYTEKGSRNWSDNPIMLTINYEPPAPSPAPTLTPKPTSTPKPIVTPKPTAKPTAKKATPKPTKKKPTPTKKTKDLLEEEMASKSGEATIAGETTQSGELISPTATPSSKFKKVLGGIFLSLGGLSVLGAGVFHFLKTKGLKFNFS